MATLQADHLTLAYAGSADIVRELSYQVQPGAITSILGPNGSGKSTLLRALARLHKPKHGAVLLDGHSIHHLPTKEAARRLSLLSQHAQAPGGITVEELVRRGRYPHQAFLQPPTHADEAAVEQALMLVGLSELRGKLVDELSGGQRQRAWIALSIAQETPILLLDEPTTYLDIAHQQEVLTLLRHLNQKEGRTIVLVLHDLNDAFQISDRVVVMRDGAIVAEGPPERILSPGLLAEVFGVSCQVLPAPDSALPVFIPTSRAPLSRHSPPASRNDALRAEGLSVGYNGNIVLRDVSATLPDGQITAIVGPNGSGKSTLLRALARLLKPQQGQVLLHDHPVSNRSHREFAQQVAFQMQGSLVPEGILVEDLVAMGRRPHQHWYRQWSEKDQCVVDHALKVTQLDELRSRPVESLSGGQQQRVWLAMTLAQQTPILLLDEPTSYLDVAHQVEVLDWIWELNHNQGRTIGLVLHDLGMACRYADKIIFMKEGKVVAAGSPEEIVTADLVQEVYQVDMPGHPRPTDWQAAGCSCECGEIITILHSSPSYQHPLNCDFTILERRAKGELRSGQYHAYLL